MEKVPAGAPNRCLAVVVLLDAAHDVMCDNPEVPCQGPDHTLFARNISVARAHVSAMVSPDALLEICGAGADGDDEAGVSGLLTSALSLAREIPVDPSTAERTSALVDMLSDLVHEAHVLGC